jgi:carboxylesterase
VISTRRRVVAAVARPLMRLTDPAHKVLSRRLTPRSADVADAPSAVAVRPEAESYVGGSGPVGVLLCHGFSGSPKSMRPWADHLESAGYRVSLPRLPGHGTSWTEMNLTTWPDWYGCVERAFLQLEAECEQVFVVGLSMGGALSLRLAEQFGSRVAGLVLVNPVINITDPRMKVLFLLRALPSLAGIANDIAKPGVDECGYDRNPLRALYSQTFLWRDVVQHLAEVDQPLLVYRSSNDHVGDPSSLELIKAGVKSADHSYVELTRSYHVATLDYEAEDIFDGSVKFIRRLAAAH